MQYQINFILLVVLWIMPWSMVPAAQPEKTVPRIDQLEEQAFREATVLVSPSVVRIETVGGLDTVNGTLTGTGATSGTIISVDGFIITSSFNFVSQPSSVFVTLADERKFPAKIISSDEIRKVTLLKIEAENLPVAKIAEKSDIKVGRWSIALGRTYALDQPNVSVGIVSALNRINGRAIQTDAKISPANYGGPLIDIEGRIQGILVPLSPQSNELDAGVEWYDSGIGFAIPMVDIMSKLGLMQQGKDLKPGILGITLKQEPGGQGPAVVGNVRLGSPAQQAGVKPKDVITAVNGVTLTKALELKNQLMAIYAGEKILLKVNRGDQSLELSVTLTDKIPPLTMVELGILPERDPSINGVKIRHVFPDSPAAKALLKPEDIITKIDATPVKTLNDIHSSLESKLAGETVELVYTRDQAVDNKVSIGLSKAKMELVQELPSLAIPAKAPDAKLPKLGLVKDKLPAFDKEYVLYTPEDYNPIHPYALVVFLHPTGDPMEVDLLKAWRAGCAHRGVILLAPQSGKTTPWDTGDLEFIQETIKLVQKKYLIDKQRVVLHGYGDVSGLVAMLGMSNPKEFPAIVVGPLSIKMSFPENDHPRALNCLFLTPDNKNLADRINIHAKAMKTAGYQVQTIPSQTEENNYPAENVIQKVILWVDQLDRF